MLDGLVNLTISRLHIYIYMLQGRICLENYRGSAYKFNKPMIISDSMLKMLVIAPQAKNFGATTVNISTDAKFLFLGGKDWAPQMLCPPNSPGRGFGGP